MKASSEDLLRERAVQPPMPKTAAGSEISKAPVKKTPQIQIKAELARGS
jgi:hypothetical protein